MSEVGQEVQQAAGGGRECTCSAQLDPGPRQGAGGSLLPFRRLAPGAVRGLNGPETVLRTVVTANLLTRC